MRLDNLVPAEEGSDVPCSSALIDWSTFWTKDRKSEDWLVEPVIPRGRSVGIFAPSKGQKSLLMLYLAAKAATGERVLDQMPGDPLNVAYFDLEMTEDDVAERLEDMGFGPESDLSHLHYYLLPNLPPLDTPEGGAAALAIGRHHHADLMVFDTMSRVVSGAENDADTLRAFYLNTGLPLKAEGITVCRLDHAGKDLARGQRGTSAKNDDVDLVWELTAQDNGALRLRATHRRQAWIPENVSLVRLDDPLRYERAVETWPAGTTELARRLDELEIPIGHGGKRVRALLREHGLGAGNGLIAASVRYRKNAHVMSGTPSGTPSFETSGTPFGDTLPFSFGDTLGDTRGHPHADTGDTGVSLKGDTVSRPGILDEVEL